MRLVPCALEKESGRGIDILAFAVLKGVAKHEYHCVDLEIAIMAALDGK